MTWHERNSVAFFSLLLCCCCFVHLARNGNLLKVIFILWQSIGSHFAIYIVKWVWRLKGNVFVGVQTELIQNHSKSAWINNVVNNAMMKFKRWFLRINYLIGHIMITITHSPMVHTFLFTFYYNKGSLQLYA